MKIENIKAFVKRDRDAVMIEEMGELVPHYFYGDDHKMYELNAMTCLLIITGQSELIKTVRPLATEDGDVEWTMENDLIGGYYEDEQDNKIPVMDKNIVAYIDKNNKLTVLDYAFVHRALEMMSNTYVTLDVWSESHGKSIPAAKRQCQLGRVRGAVQVGGLWLIPEYSPYPERVSCDEKVLELPENILDDVDYEILNQLMMNGMYDLPFGIKFEPFSDEGVRLELETSSNIIVDDYKHMTAGYKPTDNGRFGEIIGMLLPDKLDAIINEMFCSGKCDKIYFIKPSYYSICDMRWKDYDVKCDTDDFCSSGRTFSEIIDYWKVLNYFITVDDLFNNADFVDYSNIDKLNTLFFTTEDPIVLSCLTNVESFKEHMDELFK